MNVTWLLLFPLLTLAGILLVPRAAAAKWIALCGSLVQLVVAVGLYRAYSAEVSNENVILFQQQRPLFPSLGIQIHFGVDGIAVAMILLTSFVVTAGVLVSWKVAHRVREFFAMLVLLALGAYGFFISLDLFLLFFFLEVAVIPKYLLIALWGSGKREKSANKLALMLMAASALVLVGILGIYLGSSGDGRTFDLIQLPQRPFSADRQLLFFPFLFLGFGVFTAIFPFHTWVPDGHSSAPTAGSMFLAGISMKLGGYGCLRVATWLMPEGARAYSGYIILLAAIAILYGAFATLMQKDLKYMNAYSSISHCGFVLLGIGMMTRVAFTGAVLQMVSHGLMTALFFAVIGMIYERTHTRMIADMEGLMRTMPFIMTMLFLSGLCSLGLPALSGFVAEMTVFIGSWQQTGTLHRAATIVSTMSIVVTAVYILRAVGQIAMGVIRNEHSTLGDAHWYERGAAILLMAGILAIGLLPGWLMKLLEPTITMISNRSGAF
jgi:NADH-quinone oxidoreductase subunit M